MKDDVTRSLTIPGEYQPTHRNPGRVDGVYPNTLLLGVYRRPGDNSPCFLYLRTWPNGRVQLAEVDHDPLAKSCLARSSSPGPHLTSEVGDSTPACPTT
jgi:hypothetical protein